MSGNDPLRTFRNQVRVDYKLAFSSHALDSQVLMADTLAAESAITEAWDRYRYRLLEGDATGLAELFTDDAQMMQPNMADIVGRPAILALFQQLGAHDEASMESVELTVIGKTAYEFGLYQSVHSQPDPIEYRGRLAVAWRQDDDGEWRIRRMMLTPISANSIER